MSNKSVICFIDSFNSGGAQKQMVMLANGLSDNNFDVKTLQYHDLNFFSDNLSKKIEQHKILNSNKVVRLIRIIKFFYNENPNCIISFLVGPNNYATLYKIFFFWRKTNLIVSERNYNINKLKFKDFLIRFSHFFANTIVCNSIAQKEKLIPYFGNKLVFIPNGTNADSIVSKVFLDSKSRTYNLIVPARFIDQKNPLGLLRALNETSGIKIFWYGEVFKEYSIYKTCIDFIIKNKLEERFIFMPSTINIYNEMLKYDALILPSFFEGCPNSIIDAMYCGLPILASNVSDNKIYLNHQKELIFNPYSTEDIVEKLNYFKALNINQLGEIGNKNRIKAHEYFNQYQMVKKYQNLIL